MNVLKTLKEVVVVAQKSNDIEMIQKIISAQEDVLEMQDKISKLQDENNRLKNFEKFKKNIERYPGTTLVTLKNENPKIPYCSTCYGNENKLIQLRISGNLLECLNCKSFFYIDESPVANDLRSLFK